MGTLGSILYQAVSVKQPKLIEAVQRNEAKEQRIVDEQRKAREASAAKKKAHADRMEELKRTAISARRLASVEASRITRGERWFAYEGKLGRVARLSMIPLPLVEHGERHVGAPTGYPTALEAMRA